MEDIEKVLDSTIGNGDGVARDRLGQPLLDKLLEGFAHRCPADTQELGEAGLRQRLPGLELGVADRVLDASVGELPPREILRELIPSVGEEHIWLIHSFRSWSPASTA